jgi:HK97 gp10 family phage protein
MAAGMVRVELRGVRGLVKKLKQVQGSTTAPETLLSILEEAAEPIRKAASDKAPFRRGVLAESVLVERVRERRARFQGVGVFSAPGTTKGSRRSFYAHMQEFGTRHHGAQPFMRPAYDENKAQAIRIARRRIGAEIRRAAT